MRLTKELFEADGPQLSDRKCGPEPSIESFVAMYYDKFFPKNRATELTYQYIKEWLAKHG